MKLTSKGNSTNTYFKKKTTVLQTLKMVEMRGSYNYYKNCFPVQAGRG